MGDKVSSKSTTNSASLSLLCDIKAQEISPEDRTSIVVQHNGGKMPLFEVDIGERYMVRRTDDVYRTFLFSMCTLFCLM